MGDFDFSEERTGSNKFIYFDTVISRLATEPLKCMFLCP